MHNLQLEQERCDLVEELAVVKRKLSEAETLQKESNEKYQLLMERQHLESHTLKEQVENVLTNRAKPH